jgi:hypothetical protein
VEALEGRGAKHSPATVRHIAKTDNDSQLLKLDDLGSAMNVLGDMCLTVYTALASNSNQIVICSLPAVVGDIFAVGKISLRVTS